MPRTKTSPEVACGGLPCPACAHRFSDVIDSRSTHSGFLTTRRRRKCRECGHRFYCIEVLSEGHGGDIAIVSAKGLWLMSAAFAEAARRMHNLRLLPTAEEELPR